MKVPPSEKKSGVPLCTLTYEEKGEEKREGNERKGIPFFLVIMLTSLTTFVTDVTILCTTWTK